LEPQTPASPPATSAPLLSVVLTVVDGGDTLRRCLEGLLAQTGAPSMEVLVPYDATIASARTIVDDAARRAGSVVVRGIDLGRIETESVLGSDGAQHELFDRRRAAGLAMARGDLIAIVEDRGVPRPEWAATARRLHEQQPNLAIGGAIENGRDRVLNWAVYLCDFGRYQRPFDPGPRPQVSDVNVVYKRRAIEQTRAIWEDRFHEPLVHWALERGGESLFASPDLIVDQQRDDLSLTRLLRERLAWGRLYGALRAREVSLPARAALFIASPLLPGLLFGRIVRDHLVKGGSLPRLAKVSPAVIVLLTAWAAGEAVGTLTARA
jgi:hypothetical protein